MEIAGRSVQVPVTFAAIMCGQAADEILAEFADSIDPACAEDEGAAARMALVDKKGELVDLTLQEIVGVQLPDGGPQGQRLMDFATRLRGLDAGALSGDPASERRLARELTREQALASKPSEPWRGPGRRRDGRRGQGRARW